MINSLSYFIIHTNLQYAHIKSSHRTTSTEEKFEDTKRVIRIRKSKKNRKHNGQKKKDNRTNNDLQNIHINLMTAITVMHDQFIIIFHYTHESTICTHFVVSSHSTKTEINVLVRTRQD
jgi:hypothetical protein